MTTTTSPGHSRTFFRLGAYLGPFILESVNLVIGKYQGWFNTPRIAYGCVASLLFGLICFLFLRKDKPITMLWAVAYIPACYLALLFWFIAFSMTIGIPK